MSNDEVRELKTMIDDVGKKIGKIDRTIEGHDKILEGLGRTLETIRTSLKRCQARCHVDNPPGRWRVLGRALAAFFRTHQLTAEGDDAEPA
jgi:hypothetical protein